MFVNSGSSLYCLKYFWESDVFFYYFNLCLKQAPQYHNFLRIFFDLKKKKKHI